MMQMSHLKQFVFAAIVATCMLDSSLAAWGSKKAPAGQKCPTGSYVIGFDSEANIICTEACGNGVLNPGESCDDGNIESGDGCPAICRSEAAETGGIDDGIVVQAIPTDSGISPPATEPFIFDVKPSKLTFGSAELAITISGSGFHAGSVIIFQGTTYTPSVNHAGTQLKVTIPTGNLSIGPYRITVSNGPGLETTKRRALEIY